jgi:hypothetical protein
VDAVLADAGGNQRLRRKIRSSVSRIAVQILDVRPDRLDLKATAAQFRGEGIMRATCHRAGWGCIA